jgi:lipopolysaccharide/colanic/teichoic acid biosynthesis glycosyltransferase
MPSAGTISIKKSTFVPTQRRRRRPSPHAVRNRNQRVTVHGDITVNRRRLFTLSTEAMQRRDSLSGKYLTEYDSAFVPSPNSLGGTRASEASHVDPMSTFEQILKRTFDIAVASAGLLLMSPLILLVVLAIKLDTRGPLVCRYTRYRIDDTAFKVFEFPTTIAGQEDKAFNHMANSDPCVTWLGQILRRSDIYKIPQLVNVLRGDMSIVGPHPFTTALGGACWVGIPLLQLRNVRPGIVSWAQVNDYKGKTANAAETFHRRIQDDRHYLKNRSFLFDMKILFLALLSKSTYL